MLSRGIHGAPRESFDAGYSIPQPGPAPENSLFARPPEGHSGVAEGACRHLVKDRMEQTGMRWTVEGAQAMLHVRALYLNDQWEEFLEHRVQREQARLYWRTAA
jgi:hypothetical protein